MNYTVLKSSQDFEEYKKRVDPEIGTIMSCFEHYGTPKEYPCLINTFEMGADWIEYSFTYPSDVLEMAKALEMRSSLFDACTALVLEGYPHSLEGTLYAARVRGVARALEMNL